MEIKHMHYNGCEETIQIMRSACPHCHQAVQFALQEKDRQFKADAEYYQQRCVDLNRDNERLLKIIDDILETKKH